MADLVITPDDVIPSSYCGQYIPITYGADISQGMPIYISNGQAFPAIATSAAAAAAVGIAVTGGGTGQQGFYIKADPNLNLGVTLQAGMVYCVAADSLGGICPFTDLITNDFVTILGVANSGSTGLNFNITIGNQNMTTQPTTFTHTLTEGDEDGIVLDFTSMALINPPSYVRIDNAVQKTASDQANIFASAVISTITNTQVQAELNAPCDVTGRSFNWTVIPLLIVLFFLMPSAFAGGPNPVPNAQISGSSTVSGTLTNSGTIQSTGNGIINADNLGGSPASSYAKTTGTTAYATTSGSAAISGTTLLAPAPSQSGTSGLTINTGTSSIRLSATNGSVGDLVINPLNNDQVLGDPGGNIIVPTLRLIEWIYTDGITQKASIYFDPTHSGGGEWVYNSTGRVAWGWHGGYQMGIQQSPNANYIYLNSLYYSIAGDTIVPSIALTFSQNCFNSGTNNFDQIGFQATAFNTSGTATQLLLYGQANVASSGSASVQGRMTGTHMADWTYEGMDAQGQHPLFQSLAISGSTFTVTCDPHDVHQNSSITLTGSDTLAFSGLEPGMEGTILVSQDSVGSRTLALPAGSKTPNSGNAILTLSTVPFSIDKVSWIYDGIATYFTPTLAFTGTFDPAAQAFFTSGSITNPTQQQAIQYAVSALRNLTLQCSGTDAFDTLKEIWPFLGNNAASDSIGLKAALTGSFHGTVVHSSTGATGDGSSGYFDTAYISGTSLNYSAGLVCETKSLASSETFMGQNNSSGSRFDLVTSGTTSVNAGGPNNGSLGTITINVGSDFRGSLALGRSSSALANLYFVSTISGSNFTVINQSVSGSSTATLSLTVLAENGGSGAAYYYSPATVNWPWVSNYCLTGTDQANLTTILKTANSLLGR